MLNCTLDRENVGYLNSIIKEKNKLSILNNFQTKNFSKDNMNGLDEVGLVDISGNIVETIKPVIDILANPYAVIKMVFTGGAGSYEHNISYDNSFQKHVSFTVTPENVTIDDESNPKSIIKVLEDFVGVSKLKSLNISKKFNKAEGLVVASMLDMERKLILRAFVDEIPFTHNSYNTNMAWRIINSTSANIQWFVHNINEVIGEHIPLSQQQVQDAINQLITKGDITNHGGMYQLSGELSMLANRMIIVDNILNVHASKQNEQGEIIGSGFTCIQSGVHDLLLLDYNGSEIIFNTVSSNKLFDYLDQFLNCEMYFSKMRA